MLSEHVQATLELIEPASFARLSEHLSMEWIEQALAATGTASIRRRRLPAEQVVWLVIALGLYRHRSIADVLEALDLTLPNEANSYVSKSGIAQACERLGDKPLKWLFEQTARAWIAQDAAHYARKGLALYAMDGTTLRTADSPENRSHFGAQSYASGKVASYPAGPGRFAHCGSHSPGCRLRRGPLRAQRDARSQGARRADSGAFADDL